MTGSAIFYKKAKFICLEQNALPFGEDDNQFFMYCRLAKKGKTGGKEGLALALPSSGGNSQRGISNTQVQFVFGETQLKSKAINTEIRVRQTLKITQFFTDNFQHIPVIIGGDFNEEPQNKPIADIMESAFLDLFTLHKI